MAKRFLMWILMAFIITLFLCTFLPIRYILLIGIALLIAIIPLAFIRFSLKGTVLSSIVSSLLAMVLFLGCTYSADSVTKVMIGQECTISAEVTDTGRSSSGKSIYYELLLKQLNGEELPFYQQYKVYIYTDTEKIYEPGTLVEGTLRFFDTPLEFGRGREDRILMSAYQQEEQLIFTEPTGFSWRRSLYRFQSAVQSRITYGSDETKGLLHSVCFGNKDTLESDLYVSLRRIGLSHVMAVSGLHLSFAVLLFGFLFMACGIHYRVRHLLGIFVAVFFTALVGFPLSCIRACVMLAIYSFGMAMNWFSDGLTSLSMAAFLIVLANPFAIRDVGFLLSVCATLGVITLRSPLENFFFPKKIGKNHRLNAVYRSLTGIFACSVAATLTTLPIMIICFKSVSPIGPLANVVLIFPLQLIFMLGILMVLLGWIPGIGAVIGFICDILYWFIKKIAVFMGRWEFANVSVLETVGILILTLLFAIIGISVYHFLRYGRRSFMALFMLYLCFCGMFHFIYQKVHPENEVEIAFVNVGQGDCTVISKDQTAVIFDYGGSSENRYNLIDYLREKNIHTVELMAFTHLHSDHTNGLHTLLKNVYVDQIVYPDLEFDDIALQSVVQAENSSIIRAGEQYTVLGGVEISAITTATYDKTLSDQNERCVCYRIEYGDVSVLVTGDLEGEAEMKLLEENLDCSVLKVAHHGSDTSSMYPFLKKASPEIAVISVGENHYGLPDASVIERIRTICPALYITEEDGTVCFETDGKTVERILK